MENTGYKVSDNLIMLNEFRIYIQNGRKLLVKGEEYFKKLISV